MNRASLSPQETYSVEQASPELSEFLDQFVDELETQLPRYADRADDLNDLIGHTRLVADLMRQIETATQPN